MENTKKRQTESIRKKQQNPYSLILRFID